MRISIIAVGRVKEPWIRDGIAEYTGRLKRFGRLEIIEIPDERVPERYSEREISQALLREGRLLLGRKPEHAWCVAMDIHAREVGSEELAALISSRAVSGIGHMAFFVGGSNGLSAEVTDQCDDRISFGPNTWPHQLFRLMLLEQIYRAEKIGTGETYHK